MLLFPGLTLSSNFQLLLKSKENKNHVKPNHKVLQKKYSNPLHAIFSRGKFLR